MNKIMIVVAAAGALLASPAAASVELCDGPGCTNTDMENVLVNASTGATITGSTNTTGVGVTFTSPLGETLVGGANGQARVEADDGLLNSLRFTLDGGYTFGAAEWNLFPLAGNQLNETALVSLTWLLAGGGTANQSFAIGQNGQNFGGIFGTLNERFTSISFTANPTSSGWSDLRQLRLADVRTPGGGTPDPQIGGVPEPGTWATLLLGFGLLGGAMRRKRSLGDTRRLRVA